MIAQLLSIISSLLMSAFVGASSCFLYKVYRSIRLQHILLRHQTALLTGIKIRQDIDMLETIQRELNYCVEKEEFERAEYLKKLYEKQIHEVSKQIKTFNDEFGDVTNINLETIRR